MSINVLKKALKISRFLAAGQKSERPLKNGLPHLAIYA
jgi:hypothetical protein